MLLLSQKHDQRENEAFGTKLIALTFHKQIPLLFLLAIMAVVFSMISLPLSASGTNQTLRPAHALSIKPRITRPALMPKGIKVFCVSAQEFYPYFDFAGHAPSLKKLDEPNTIVNDFGCNFFPYTVSLREYKRSNIPCKVSVLSVGTGYAKKVRYLPRDAQLKQELDNYIINAFNSRERYSYLKSLGRDGFEYNETALDPSILSSTDTEFRDGSLIGKVLQDLRMNYLNCPGSIKDKNEFALTLKKEEQWQPVVDLLIETHADLLTIHSGCLEDLQVIKKLIESVKGQRCKLQIAHCNGGMLENFKDVNLCLNKVKRKKTKPEPFSSYISDAWITLDEHCLEHGLGRFETRSAKSASQQNRKTPVSSKTACPVGIIVKDAGLAFTASSIPIGLAVADERGAIQAHVNQIYDLAETIKKTGSFAVIHEFCNMNKQSDVQWGEKLGEVVETENGKGIFPVTFIRGEDRYNGADSLIEVEFYRNHVVNPQKALEKTQSPVEPVEPQSVGGEETTATATATDIEFAG